LELKTFLKVVSKKIAAQRLFSFISKPPDEVV